MTDKFIITMEQLKSMVAEQSGVARLKLASDVMNAPLHEKTIWDNIYDILAGIWEWIDELTDDKKKVKKV